MEGRTSIYHVLYMGYITVYSHVVIWLHLHSYSGPETGEDKPELGGLLPRRMQQARPGCGWRPDDHLPTCPKYRNAEYSKVSITGLLFLELVGVT